MGTKKILYLGLGFVSAMLLFMWTHTLSTGEQSSYRSPQSESLPATTTPHQPGPSSAPANMSVPYSNIADPAMHAMLRTGILREEDLFNFSHSLENRFQLGIQQESTYKLPRILHFIWVGAPIKPNYVDSINLFAIHNPNYKVRSKEATRMWTYLNIILFPIFYDFFEFIPWLKVTFLVG